VTTDGVAGVLSISVVTGVAVLLFAGSGRVKVRMRVRVKVRAYIPPTCIYPHIPHA